MTETIPPATAGRRPLPLPPRYRLVRLRAETRMSQVFEAVDQQAGQRRVAVKLLSPYLAGEPGCIERFRREAWMGRMLNHENIVGCLDAWRAGEPVYLVMPYVDGPDLGTVLQNGPLDLDRTLRIIRQVATALKHAHAANIVHRDVKPSNILLTGDAGDAGDERAFLCDFGIAACSGNERLTTVGQFLGTPGVAPPELLTGRIDQWGVDRRADVYALGGLVHHCLTGRPPFDHVENGMVLYDQLNTEPAKISDLRPGWPKAIDRVVRRAMSLNPDDRYETCGEFMRELEWAASHGRRRAVIFAAAAAARRWPFATKVRRRTFAGVSAGLVLAVAIAGGAITIARQDIPSAAELARVPASLRDNCRRTSVAEGFDGAASVLSCTSGGARVRVSLFDQPSAASTAYARTVRQHGIRSASGECTAGGSAEHRYPTTGPTVGRVMCDARPGGTTVVWSNSATRTLAVTGPLPNDAAVAAWATVVGIPAFPTLDEKRLADLVGLKKCRRTSASAVDNLPKLRVAIDCAPGGTGANTVTYLRFDNPTAREAAHGKRAQAVKAPTAVDCGGKAFPGFFGESAYLVSDNPPGRIMCLPGTKNRRPEIEWTIDSDDIIGRTSGAVPDSLIDWWREHMSTLTPGITSRMNSRISPPFPTPAERKLLTHIPAAVRVNCMRTPVGVAADLLSTSVPSISCSPGPGVFGVKYFQFSTKSAMDKAFNTNPGPVNGPDCTKNPPNFAGDRAYRRGRDYGRLMCSRGGRDQEARTMYWTNDRLNIIGRAYWLEDGPTVIQRWKTQAGPV